MADTSGKLYEKNSDIIKETLERKKFFVTSHWWNPQTTNLIRRVFKSLFVFQFF